jgi:hypothetical protein
MPGPVEFRVKLLDAMRDSIHAAALEMYSGHPQPTNTITTDDFR